MNTTPILLVIGYVWPEPNSSAAGSRMLQLIALFQQAGYCVHYASPAEYSDHSVDLAALGIIAARIKLNCQSFDQYVKALNPNVVMFDRFMMEEQFGWRVETQCPEALRLLDTEDLHSLRHARAAMLKAAPNTCVKEPSLSFRHSELAVREMAAILRCDLSLMISEFEIDWLVRCFQIPKTQLCYVPFMLEQAQADKVPSFAQRQHFVSIGNFRHEPNWDAVRYLREILWPKIRTHLPKAQLHIYGAYPPPKATQLHNERLGFHVKGWASNAHQVIADARVLLAPLRFGAGLKGKLIDAAQCGTPAVTTSIGAEGVYGEIDAARIADEPDAFVAHALELYCDEARWQHCHEQALTLVEKRFSWQSESVRVWAEIVQVRDHLAAHRLQHFYGQMLRHHSLKSTQYMAQWIEAKNKD